MVQRLEDALEDLLREVSSVEEDVLSSTVERLYESVAARLACHASIRAGQELTAEEVYSLFSLLDSAECSAACPHGRPVVVSFSPYQIERWFGRVG